MNPLGEGVHTLGEVMAVAEDTVNHYTYIAGVIEGVDGLSLNGIARYDGTNWSALGSGIVGTVLGMKIIGTDLYVVGYIQSAGGVPVNNIAKWDGSSWSSVGQGLPLVLREIEYYQNKIYVTGFPPFGSLSYLACFDGNSWNQNLGTFDRNVVGMFVNNGDLYIYGEFLLFNTDTVHGIIKYNGSNFQYFPAVGVYGVSAAALVDTTVYVLNAYDASVDYFDGNQWQNYYSDTTMGERLTGLFSYQNALGVILDSTQYSTTSGNYKLLRKMTSPGSWSRLLRMRNDNHTLVVDDVVSYGNSLHVAGLIDHIDDTLAISYFHYNGNNWENPGKPKGPSYLNSWVNSSVSTLVKDPVNGDIIVGGRFIYAGNSYSPNVARWDGTSWHAMGQGLSSSVSKLLYFNNELYAFGYFGRAGSNWVGRVAKWNGASWQPVGTGFDGAVMDAVVYNNAIYACGSFTNVDGMALNYVAKYDGVSWSQAGDGVLDETTTHLFVYNNQLIASAQLWYNFIFPQNSSMAYLDQNDQWQLMDENLVSEVSSVCEYNNHLYVSVNGSSDFGLYEWDGLNFNQVSSLSGSWPSGGLIVYRGNLFATISNEGFYLYDSTALSFNRISDIQPYAFLEDTAHDYVGGFFPYYLEGTSEVYLNSMAEITLELPVVSISSNTDTICERGYVYFNSSAHDPFLSYTWHFQGGVPDSLSYAEPIIQYNTPGVYTAYLVAQNLVGTDTIYLNNSITVLPCITNVGEEELKASVIYPNPFVSEIHFNSEAKLNRLIVADLSGKIVYDDLPEKNSADFSFLNPGVYFLTCMTASSVQTFRIVKL